LINNKRDFKMASYYKKIKGKNYDRALLDLADSSTKGKGDGRISINDAKKLFKKIKDSDTYTDIEKRTVQYIRDNFKFTKEADSFFRSEVRKWASGTKGSEKKAPVSKKKTSVKKKTDKKTAAKKPSAKKKAVKKPAAKKKDVKKPAAKKKAAKEPAVKKEETGFTPALAEPEIREAEAVQSAAAVPEGKEEGSRNPVVIVLIVAVVAVLGFYILPRFKKFIFNDRKGIPGETVSEKGEEAEVKKAGDREENTAGQKPEKKEAVDADKSVTRPVPATEDKNVYTVQVKDQLTAISYKFYGNYHDWKKIYHANRDRIKDPTLIFPGQKLVIPEKK
jgi:nucleoid-associated protein YgaU